MAVRGTRRESNKEGQDTAYIGGRFSLRCLNRGWVRLEVRRLV